MADKPPKERKPPKDPLDHEPEAVTWAREKAGLTRAQVAAQLGVSAGLISEIEKGTRNATPARLQQMAEVFNCPVVVLERKRYATCCKSTSEAAALAH